MYDPEKECRRMTAALMRLCEERGIRPYALAKEAGISTSTISYLVNGKTKPQVYTVLSLCNVLGVTIGELFGGERSAEDTDKREVKAAEKERMDRKREEEELLSCCRSLPEEKKRLLKLYLDMLVQYDGRLIPGVIDTV